MNQAQLIDGRMVSTSSEDWRAECEARYALKMDLTRRRAFIEAVEKQRGKPAADKLRASIKAVWDDAR